MADSDPDRQSSILTETQREFLIMSDEERQEKYSKQMRSYHRRKINERVRNAFRDFELLYEQLSDEQRATALSPGPGPHPSLDRGFLSVMALIFEQRGVSRFPELVEPAVTHALAENRDLGSTSPSNEGVSVGLEITHTVGNSREE